VATTRARRGRAGPPRESWTFDEAPLSREAARARKPTGRRSLRRRRALLAGLALLGAITSGSFAAAHVHDDTRASLTGFDLAGGRTALGLTQLRRERNLALVVHGGACIDDDERRTNQRLEGVEQSDGPTAVLAAVRIEEQPPSGRSCADAGVGLRATLHLARPIGDRALITYAGPYQFRLILIPPEGRAAVRRFVVPRHRDRNQPPRFMYYGPACDLVARYLADLPESRWCFY
jgi:hypothetical protein